MTELNFHSLLRRFQKYTQFSDYQLNVSALRAEIILESIRVLVSFKMNLKSTKIWHHNGKLESELFFFWRLVTKTNIFMHQPCFIIINNFFTRLFYFIVTLIFSRYLLNARADKQLEWKPSSWGRSPLFCRLVITLIQKILSRSPECLRIKFWQFTFKLYGQEFRAPFSVTKSHNFTTKKSKHSSAETYIHLATLDNVCCLAYERSCQ